MDKYRKYQYIATFGVAFFIVSFALCLLVMNRSVFERCVQDYEARFPMGKETQNDASEAVVTMSAFEMQLVYEQVADSFSSFWGRTYPITGYAISLKNVDRLNRLKGYYRLAWVVAVVSFFCAVYSFIILSKRREYMPFLYGSVLAALFTSLNALFIMSSKGELLSGIRQMILHEDYSYFAGGDALQVILLPELARNLALVYILFVFVLILIMVFIRFIIIFSGRPHKF